MDLEAIGANPEIRVQKIASISNINVHNLIVMIKHKGNGL